MRLNWDYSQLAKTYSKRPNYSQPLIEEIIQLMSLKPNSTVCDMGAGTGFLTQLMAPHVKAITAVEPNDNMRTVGISHCQRHTNIQWVNGRAEATGLPAGSFDAITFGSSFNVVDQRQALAEANRLCKPHGWLLAIWNHRDLKAPLQKKIEAYILSEVPDYQYGARRKDQQPILENSQLFSEVRALEKPMLIEQNAQDVIAAWESHATLQRQAGTRHALVIKGISAIIDSQSMATLKTPYVTRAWLAKFK